LSPAAPDASAITYSFCALYEASTGGFLELITARRTLQDVESMALNRLADHEVAIAELEGITGNPTPNQSGKEVSK